jgi:hypothetical protein
MCKLSDLSVVGTEKNTMYPSTPETRSHPSWHSGYRQDSIFNNEVHRHRNDERTLQGKAATSGPVTAYCCSWSKV